MNHGNTHKVAALLVLGLGLGLSSCKKKQDSDNPDVAAGHRGVDNNDYEGDIVTADRSQDYADQGQGISPETLQNIDDTILTVYLTDIERCLEDEMSEAETRFMRSAFLVEFTINTAGQTSQGKVLQIETRKQTAKGADAGEIDSGPMKSCIETSVTQWEFDPAPEIDFVHTYRGRVGEAF